MATLDPTKRSLRPNASVIPGAPGSPEYAGPTVLPETNPIVDAITSPEVVGNLQSLGPVGGAASGVLRSLRFPIAAAQTARAVPATAAALTGAGQVAQVAAPIATVAGVAAPTALAATRANPPVVPTAVPTATAPAVVPAAPTTLAASGAAGGVASSAERTAQLGRDIEHQKYLQTLRNPNDPTPGAAIIGPADYASRNDKFFEEAALRNALARTTTTRRGTTVDPSAEVLAQQVGLRRKGEQDAAIENQRSTTAQQLAATRDATDRRGQDIAQATTLRGQDVTLAGQTLTARTAAATARLDQQNKDRTYDLEKQRFGVEVADKNRTARAAEEKAVDDNLALRFRTTDADGKDVVDSAKVAAFKTAAQATLDNVIAQHKAAGNTAKAEELSKRGLAALDTQDLEKLQGLFDVRERARAASGNFPSLTNSARFIDSNNLLDYEQTGVDPRTFGSDRATLRGGSSIAGRDLIYSDGPSSFFGLANGSRSDNLPRALRRKDTF